MFKRALVGCLLLFQAIPAISAPVVDHWSVIAESFFKDRAVIEKPDTISITAPLQAEDSALVPISIHFAESHGFVKWYLFVDANPIMLTLTTRMPDLQHALSLSTRIRLDANSQVRVIGERPDGQLNMAVVAIKTPGGGCGGAVSQDEAALRASAGKMKLRQADDGEAVVLQIQHPMRTGFERTVYGYYAKAWYVDKIALLSAGEPVLDLQLGPGISANPYFRIELPLDISTLSVRASDNENQTFRYPL